MGKFHILAEYLSKRMRMSHVYQPVMIMKLLSNDGKAKADEIALDFKEALIGINNRNLKTLKTDINTTYDIHNVLVNHQGPLISESGIRTKEELLDLKNKTSINTFLIGESLLKNLEKNSIFSVL